MSVMSLRLSKEQIVQISKLSAQKKEGKSKVVRELLQRKAGYFTGLNYIVQEKFL